MRIGADNIFANVCELLFGKDTMRRGRNDIRWRLFIS